jgi:type II secretory pathway pseudopilin PulG
MKLATSFSPNSNLRNTRTCPTKPWRSRNTKTCRAVASREGGREPVRRSLGEVGTPNADSGFTLVELLAAITSIVVVLSAATGFLITVMARQKAVLEASQLEAVHSQLADIMYDAMKTAEDFQIFADATRLPGNLQTPYGEGVSAGKVLSCRRSGIQRDFEFRDGASGSGEIIQTTTGFARAPVVKTFSAAQPPPGGFFSMKNGLLQAHWSAVTSMERLDFNVYGTPLNMR